MLKRSIWVCFAVVLCVFFLLNCSGGSQPSRVREYLWYGDRPQGNACSGAKVTGDFEWPSNGSEVRPMKVGNYSVTHLVPDAYQVKTKRRVQAYDVASTPVAADSSVHLDAQLQVGP